MTKCLQGQRLRDLIFFLSAVDTPLSLLDLSFEAVFTCRVVRQLGGMCNVQSDGTIRGPCEEASAYVR